jgi:aminoglycoside 6'-N-acetyltransferase I
MVGVEVRPVSDADQPVWARMRQALWPDCDPAAHEADTAAIRAAGPLVAFIAWRDDQAVGFAEATVRSHVDGSPAITAAFLEGIWTAPDARRSGVAAALLATVERWAADRGCAYLGSDALDADLRSHAWHQALGFERLEHVVQFLKRLPTTD